MEETNLLSTITEENTMSSIELDNVEQSKTIEDQRIVNASGDEVIKSSPQPNSTITSIRKVFRHGFLSSSSNDPPCSSTNKQEDLTAKPCVNTTRKKSSSLGKMFRKGMFHVNEMAQYGDELDLKYLSIAQSKRKEDKSIENETVDSSSEPASVESFHRKKYGSLGKIFRKKHDLNEKTETREGHGIDEDVPGKPLPPHRSKFFNVFNSKKGHSGMSLSHKPINAEDKGSHKHTSVGQERRNTLQRIFNIRNIEESVPENFQNIKNEEEYLEPGEHNLSLKELGIE